MLKKAKTRAELLIACSAELYREMAASAVSLVSRER